MTRQRNPWKYAALAALTAAVVQVKVEVRREPPPSRGDPRVSYAVSTAFGNSPAECEADALAQARVFFGPEATLTLEPSGYGVVPVEDIYRPEAGGKKFRTSGGLRVYASTR